jgi:hypothetical protein
MLLTEPTTENAYTCALVNYFKRHKNATLRAAELPFLLMKAKALAALDADLGTYDFMKQITQLKGLHLRIIAQYHDRELRQKQLAEMMDKTIQQTGDKEELVLSRISFGMFMNEAGSASCAVNLLTPALTVFDSLPDDTLAYLFDALATALGRRETDRLSLSEIDVNGLQISVDLYDKAAALWKALGPKHSARRASALAGGGYMRALLLHLQPKKDLKYEAKLEFVGE